MAGVDLSAEPAGTAVAIVEQTDRIRVTALWLGNTDDQVVARTEPAEKIGVDCAFGWPVDFVEFVRGHSDGDVVQRRKDELGKDWRRRLAYRETDRAVSTLVRKQPLSVATDRLGLTAMRCALLLEAFVSAGRDVNRSGSGAVVEVYPGAALKLWGLHAAGYKTSQQILDHLVDVLKDSLPQLELSEFESLVRRSDDALDAVIAGLIALASVHGLCSPIPDEHRQLAEREGWIAIPPQLSVIGGSRGGQSAQVPPAATSMTT